MFFFIQNTEDGLQIKQVKDAVAAIREIAEENLDLRPESQYTFVDTIPDEYTDEYKICIIEGTVRLPTPVERITDYVL